MRHPSLMIVFLWLGLSLFNSGAQASILFVIDTGEAMQQGCGSSGENPLAQIANRVSALKPQSDAAFQLTNLAGAELDDLSLETLSSNKPGVTDLLSALANHKVDQRERVVIIGDKVGLQAQILSVMTRYGQTIPRFEVYLFDPASKNSLAEVFGTSKKALVLNEFGCPKVDDWQRYVDRVMGDVQQKIADAFGVSLANVSISTELKADLGADSLRAYEVVAELAGFYRVPAPQAELNTVQEIATYLTQTQLDKGLVDTYGDEIFSRDIPEDEELHIQTVFYGTNRRAKTEDGNVTYTGERGEGLDPIQYGTVDVVIPKNHKRGQLETPFLNLEIFSDPKEHFQILRINPMTADSFFNNMKGYLDSSNNDMASDIVIYVHGFATTFDVAAKRAAQIAYDFAYKGIPMMFTWPSNGQFYGYISDREDVQWSVSHIAQFLETVLDEAKPKRVHLVAHSMGNQGLIGALHRMAIERQGKITPLFENVILAAPDFDAQLFADQIAQDVLGLANRWTVYSSDKDTALHVSTKVGNAYRLGLPVTPVKGVAVVDATGIEVTPWSVPEFHSYYASKQEVIKDMVSVINGLSPKDRQLVKKMKAGIPYWQFGGRD